MLISFSPRVRKTFAATPGWLRIPAPTIETLPTSGSVSTPADVERLEHLGRRAQVVAGDREREVGLLVVGDRLVLDDHVDVDVRVGEGAEHAPGDAGLVARARSG